MMTFEPRLCVTAVLRFASRVLGDWFGVYALRFSPPQHAGGEGKGKGRGKGRGR